jgi:uncharacterized oligopeptide transporter (OPT) family protein
MTLPSALIGFAFFKSTSKYWTKPFTPMENVLVQTISSSLGGMPVIAGYTGVIPVLELLTTSKENGPFKSSLLELVIWSLGTCLLGIAFATALRYHFIIRRPLRFPTGRTAVAVPMGLLYKRSDIIENVEKDQEAPLTTKIPSMFDTEDTPEGRQTSDTQEGNGLHSRSLGSTQSMESDFDVKDDSYTSSWHLKAPILAFGVSGGFVSVVLPLLKECFAV